VLLLLNLALLGGFAVAARSMLAAREVSWVRLGVASLIGFVLGLAIGGLLVLGPEPDLSDFDDVAATDFYVAALPFQLVITMGFVVVFELARSRPRTRHRLTSVRPVQAVRRRLAIAGRGIAVSRVAAKHGLTSRRAARSSPTEQARALRASIEDLGGVYVKLGQLLATRPDLLPPEAIAELGRLHASVTPLSIEQVRAVLADELGDLDEVFADIDPHPLGSASIAQAHVATLADGSEVVVKVQRPGLERDVERDLAILDWVADNAERRLPIAASYGVAALADDFADALRRELDFRNEARDVAGVAAAVADVDEIRVPAVLEQYTTPRVLVMERLLGRPVSEGGDEPVPHATALADALCDSQLRAMMRGERFHGDPHPGNVLLLDDGQLGLIDFGMTGKLDSFGRAFVVEMLVAIRLRDPALMYEALVTGGAVELGENREQVERALATFMSAHLGSTMISADAMTELLRLTAELGIALPEQASVMFRAIATLVGTLETLCPGYPFVDRVSQAAGVEMRAGMMPTSVGELLQREATTLAPFVRRLPRHVDRLASQLERGQLTTRISLLSTTSDVRVLERLLNKALLAVLGLGVVALAILLLRTETGPEFGEQGFYLTQLFGWIGLFFGSVLVLRSLLDVLRRVPVIDSPTRWVSRQNNEP
jgi:ubiquinone biosynthesis protein